MTKHLSGHVDPDSVEYLSICMYLFFNLGGMKYLVYPCHFFFFWGGPRPRCIFDPVVFLGHCIGSTSVPSSIGT